MPQLAEMIRMRKADGMKARHQEAVCRVMDHAAINILRSPPIGIIH